MKNIITTIIAIVLSTILFNACSENDEMYSEPDLFKIGEVSEGNYTLMTFANKPLAVGYNNLYFEFLEDGLPVEEASIQFVPMMHMAAHSHASPHGKPGIQRGESGLFEAWNIFTMPGGGDEYWELQLSAMKYSSTKSDITAEMKMEVEQSEYVRMFMTESGNRYIVTLVEPSNPEVGLNDLVISIHKRASMMNFPPVLDAKIDFEPWMPSMDHGSANNVTPVHEADGFYHGSVNFNMTGNWELRFEIEVDGEIKTLVFELIL